MQGNYLPKGLAVAIVLLLEVAIQVLTAAKQILFFVHRASCLAVCSGQSMKGGQKATAPQSNFAQHRFFTQHLKPVTVLDPQLGAVWEHRPEREASAK